MGGFIMSHMNVKKGNFLTVAVAMALLSSYSVCYADSYGATNTVTGNSALAVGITNTASGDKSVALGVNNKAQGNNAIAIGINAGASSDYAVSIGYDTNKVAAGAGSTAVGKSAISSADLSSAYGNDARATATRASALGWGTMASGVSSTAVGASAKASGGGAVSVGYSTTASNTKSIAVGTESTVSGNLSGAIGSYNQVAQANTYVMGNQIQSTQANSVILGNGSTDRAATTETNATIGELIYSDFAGQGSKANGVVSIAKAGTERQLINVAAGNVSATSTDAVNGSQLYAVGKTVNTVATSAVQVFGGNASVDSTGNITMSNIGGTNKNTVDDAIKAVKTDVDQVAQNVDQVTQDVNQIAQDVSQINQNINNFGSSIRNLDQRLNKVGAGAAALASLHPLDFDEDDKLSVAAGYGNYKNANAMAIGAFYRPNEDTMFSVASSLGNGENMINASVSLKFGSPKQGKPSRSELAKEVAELRELVNRLLAEKYSNKK